MAAQGSHFFTLFAFALNNQHDATVNFFFGTHWRAPLVLVVLVAFAGGIVVGALGMLPGWWKHRSNAAKLPSAAASPAAALPVANNGNGNNNNELPVARHHGL